MKTNSRRTFAVLVLTALGVLPAPAQSTESRSARSHLGPVDLELATIVAAVKQVHQDIRAGRLGH